VFCSLMVFLTNIWAGVATDFKSLAAARIIMGFFLAPCESLSQVIIPDMFFLHERGFWMGYMVFYLINGSVITIGTGFLIAVKGWRWFVWVRPLRLLD
jgi:MFS family permease